MLGKRRAVKVIEPPKKRRKAAPAIEEITFDPTAREDYLAGFHKRKLQRAKHAREEALKKEREEKITARKMLRESRKADLEKHVTELNSLLRRETNSDSDEALAKSGTGQKEDPGGSADISEPSDAAVEAEYPDEDRYTTVTVEAVEVSRDGLHRAADDEASESDGGGLVGNSPKSKVDEKEQSDAKRISGKAKSGTKKKRKKFRYESKIERKMTRHKERSKNSARAKDRKS